MSPDLYVKSLALIKRAEISLEEGLSTLIGETGAGKSIIIGSVNMALGGKVLKDAIQQGAEYAYVKLIFRAMGPERIALLQAVSVELPKGGALVMSKKIMPSRSVDKVNGMTVTAAKLKEITSLLIDIHGRYKRQSLLYKSKHLQTLDACIKSWTSPIKSTIVQVYRSYQELQERIKSLSMDRESRLREADFCRFEIEESGNVDLQEGEEEELTVLYRKSQHGRKIMGGLSAAGRALSSESISVALKEVDRVAEFDEALGPIRDQLYDADSVIWDIIHDVSFCIDSFSFDEEKCEQIGEWLDVIHGLQAKHDDDISDVIVQLEEKGRRLEELENYDMILVELESELVEVEWMLEAQSQELSTMRREAAGVLVDRIRQGLEDLNFVDVRFDMKFRKLDHYTSSEYDEAEFLISTNPGEPVRPLGTVASGGELSRIILAIKAALVGTDEMPTPIFDETDTEINGRIAQKVSEKLPCAGRSHQVIRITHLPRIAAMTDTHYEVTKSTVGGRTTTTTRQLDYEQMIQELVRLLGDAKIADVVYDNTREMKKLTKR